MEAHHVSLGRRKLDEIRQKRAAEKLGSGFSESDLYASDLHGTQTSGSLNGLSENYSSQSSQIKGLEKKNIELQEENNKLLSEIREKEAENEMLQKHINDLERNSLPSLRKVLADVQMEKDAAVMGREDLSAQLRSMKKRLKEAEEEQYRAEEDATALRAEIKVLQDQLMGNQQIGFNSINPFEQFQTMEKEISDLKAMLLQESLFRQQDQQKLLEEQLTCSALISEKKELEDRLAMLDKATEQAIEEVSCTQFTKQEKEKMEKQLHDMAGMVERLESGRQILLAEIDAQSSEIERLFEENSDISASYQDAIVFTAQWEEQVKNCLKQNEELRNLLDKFWREQANAPDLLAIDMSREVGTEANISECVLLKRQLANEQARAEALSAEVLKLSAEVKHADQTSHNLTHIYRPILRNIETGLTKIKHESL